VVTGLLFAAWEIVDHAFLMGVEMVAYHVIGFAVETTFAAIGILWLAHSSERARLERERADALAAIVAEALGSEDAQSSPVTSLIRAVDEAEKSAEDKPEIREQLSRIRRDVRRIQVANRGLKEILWPEVDAPAR